jgi:hypothetical protein
LAEEVVTLGDDQQQEGLPVVEQHTGVMAQAVPHWLAKGSAPA